MIHSWHSPDTSRSFPTDIDHVLALSFSPDGGTIAVAGGRPAEFGVVELRSWPDGGLIRRIDGHEDVVDDVTWLDDGAVLATASSDRLVKVWDVGTGFELARLDGHSGPVRALAVSPDGSLLCSGSVDGTIRVWRAGSWTLERAMTNHLDAVHDLAFRPDRPDQPGRSLPTLASAGEDGTVRIWQPSIGRMVRIIRHPAPVLAVAWEPGGDRLASAAKDGTIRLIDGGSNLMLDTHRLDSGWLTSIVPLDPAGRFLVGRTNGQSVVVVLDPDA